MTAGRSTCAPARFFCAPTITNTHSKGIRGTMGLDNARKNGCLPFEDSWFLRGARPTHDAVEPSIVALVFGFRACPAALLKRLRVRGPPRFSIRL